MHLHINLILLKTDDYEVKLTKRAFKLRQISEMSVPQ